MTSDPSQPPRWRTRTLAWPPYLTHPLVVLEIAFYAIPALAVLSDPSPNAVLFIALAVAGIGALRAGWRPVRPGRGPTAVFAALALWSAATSAWSYDPTDTLIHTLKLVAILLAGWLLWEMIRQLLDGAEPAFRRRLSRAAVTGLALGCGVLLVELLLDHPLQRLLTWDWDPASRAIRDHDTNRGASLIAVLAWLCLPLAYRLTSRPWAAGAGLGGAILAAMLVTESAATQVGMLAGAGFFAVALAGRWARRAGLALAVMLGLLATPWLAQEGFDRGLHTADWLPSTAQQRIYFWNYAGAWALEKPVTGWGFHTSRNIPNRGVEPAKGKSDVIPLHPHNAGLQIWLELGVPGVVLMLAAYLLVTARIERTGMPWAPWLGTAAVTTFAIADIGYGAWQTQWIAAIAWAVIYARVACRLSHGRA
jgi:O-antigen ligase